jgi:hypothetical protein
MYTYRHEFSLRCGLRVDDENFRGFKNVLSASQLVCVMLSCISQKKITKEHPNCWELWKIVTFCQILQCVYKKGGCASLSNLWRSLWRVEVCWFFCIVNLWGGVMSIFQFMQSICTQRFVSQVQFGTSVLL